MEATRERRSFQPLLVVAVLAAVLGSIEPARAACVAERQFGSFFGGYIYREDIVSVWGGTYQTGVFNGPVPTVGPEIYGVFWALGAGDPAAGSGIDSGTWAPLGAWLTYDTDPPSVYYPTYALGAWSDSTEIDGCIDAAGSDPVDPDPDQCMVVLLSDHGQLSDVGYFAALTAQVEPSGDYDLGQHGEVILHPVPRGHIEATRQVGADSIEVDLIPDPPAEPSLYLDGPVCDTGVVAGYKVYVQQVCRNRPSPVGRLRDDGNPHTGWELAAGGAGPGGAPIPLDEEATLNIPSCFGHTDVYFAVSLVFDSGYELRYLSANSSPIKCDAIPWADECLLDVDGDGFVGSPGPDCDDDDSTVHPGAPQLCDGVNNDCDDPLWPQPPAGETDPDGDGDGAGDACDNCVFDRNRSQGDGDEDGEGDVCDLDDGQIVLLGQSGGFVEWQEEAGFDAWNFYAGDLQVLRAGGAYTQVPGSNDLAERQCGLSNALALYPATPDPGAAAFFLVSGVDGGIEGGLGEDSADQPRPSEPLPVTVEPAGLTAAAALGPGRAVEQVPERAPVTPGGASQADLAGAAAAVVAVVVGCCAAAGSSLGVGPCGSYPGILEPRPSSLNSVASITHPTGPRGREVAPSGLESHAKT